MGERVGIARVAAELARRLGAVAGTLPVAARCEDGWNTVCGEHPVARRLRRWMGVGALPG